MMKKKQHEELENLANKIADDSKELVSISKRLEKIVCQYNKNFKKLDKLVDKICGDDGESLLINSIFYPPIENLYECSSMLNDYINEIKKEVKSSHLFIKEIESWEKGLNPNSKINSFINLLNTYEVNLRDGNPHSIKCLKVYLVDDFKYTFFEKELSSYDNPTIKINARGEIIFRGDGDSWTIRISNKHLSEFCVLDNTGNDKIIVLTSPLYRYYLWL